MNYGGSASHAENRSGSKSTPLLRNLKANMTGRHGFLATITRCCLSAGMNRGRTVDIVRSDGVLPFGFGFAIKNPLVSTS